MKGNIIYYGWYIKFMYIVINVVIWGIVCFNVFVIFLDGKVRISKVGRVV